MQRLSTEQRRFLVAATEKYRLALPGSPAEFHISNRGLIDAAPQFRLGYVHEPEPGHEQYRGMLAIPYVRPSRDGAPLVIKIRFRNLGEGTKYLDVAGAGVRLFNTRSVLRDTINICLTEGEFDTIAAEQAGFPSVGVPGAANWKPHFAEVFMGYNKVFILADGDEAGMQFANKVAKELPNGVVIPAPAGEDVNSTIQRYGSQYYRERLR